MNASKKNKNTLRFIELYRSHPVLWDMHSDEYRRLDLKATKAYEAISVETKLPVEKVKKKIETFRTVYSAEKAKVDKSKRSGCGADTIYSPKLAWFQKMSFLDASTIRRRTVDNSNAGEVTGTALVSDEDSQPTCSKKAKRGSQSSDLADAIEKLADLNRCGDVFENFCENVGLQLSQLPEVKAYQLMTEMQSMLSQAKIEALLSLNISFIQ